MCSVAVRPVRSMRRSRTQRAFTRAHSSTWSATASQPGCRIVRWVRPGMTTASPVRGVRLSSLPVTSSARPAGAVHDHVPGAGIT